MTIQLVFFSNRIIMKQLGVLIFLTLLCAPTFAQYATSADYNLSADYRKYNNIKKAGVAGIVVFGATWLAGSSICVVEQNRYANDRWDGNDVEEFARLSNEAKQQPAYKRGEVMGIIGCIGTGVSIFLTARYGAKARRIKNATGESVAMMGLDFNPQGLSLSLTF